MKRCPLCTHEPVFDFYRDAQRSYLRCPRCSLVFVPKEQHISLEDECKEYSKHQNNPADVGYRKFLDRLCTPLSQKLKPNSCGLDFGCGPGPTLSVMLAERGHRMTLYDKCFFDDPGVFSQPYDFITATEVVEHLSAPREALDKLWTSLKPGGFLGLMTKLVIDQQAFTTWHYKNDPTHISYFSHDSLRWLADYWGASFEVVAADAFIFTKA